MRVNGLPVLRPPTRFRLFFLLRGLCDLGFRVEVFFVQHRCGAMPDIRDMTSFGVWGLRVSYCGWPLRIHRHTDYQSVMGAMV